MSTDLRAFVLEHRDEILARCLKKLRTRLPELPDAELMIPTEFLDEVAEELGKEHPSITRESAHRARGRRRRQIHVPPQHLVRDFGDVCDAIFESAGERGEHVEPHEAQTVNHLVDLAAAFAIESYWRLDETARKGGTELTELLGAFAHDLRNAASSARFAFHILREGKAPMRGRTADVIVRSLDRIQTLSTQVLDLARTSSQGAQARSQVEIAALMREIDSASFPDRGVTLRMEVTDGPVVIADERLLRSALENLVQNALKFTRDGGAVVVRAGRSAGFVTIEIEDECGGLPADPAALFEPFVQGGDARTGAGLGLTIAKRAVEADGGSLSWRDLPGKGCVFTVRLLAPAGLRAGG